MTTKEIKEYSDILEDTFQMNKDLVSYLIKIAQQRSQLTKWLLTIDMINGSQPQETHKKVMNIRKELREVVSYIIDDVRAYKPLDIITGLNQIKNVLIQFPDISDVEEAQIEDSILSVIQSHTNTYSEKSLSHLLEFINDIFNFLDIFNRFYFFTFDYRRIVHNDEQAIPIGNEKLEIYLSGSIDRLVSFNDFLDYIDTLYRELCKGYNVYYDEFPLKIIKVESGSLYSYLFGNTEIIKTIKEIIFGLASYIKDWQTGALEKEKFLNEAVKADFFIDLIEKAKGSDLSEENIVLLNRAFKKSVNGIVEKLPEDTKSISINGTNVMTLSDAEIKLIEERRILLLTQNKNKN